MEGFRVSLDEFEGPLDLMLHLVSVHKLDLFDLDLLELARQYIDFITGVIGQNLEVGSEYLVELSTLIEYKSKKLLPRQQEEEAEQGYEESQEQKMARRLQEYQVVKEESEKLKLLYEKRSELMARPADKRIYEYGKPVYQNAKGSAGDLYKAMERILRRYAIMEPYKTKVEVSEISVEERMEQIRQMLEGRQTVLFETLCMDCETLHMLITTFLAVLELVHENFLAAWLDEKEQVWMQRKTN